VTSTVTQLLADALARMPDPTGTADSEALERGLCDAFQVPNVVAVSSGTAALHTALTAVGVGPGDEVLVPAVSVVMSVVPIIYAGARPVFIDATPDGGLDLDDAAAKCGPAARAIIPVYLWGRCGDSDALVNVINFAADRGLHIVEDACQAHGSRVGGRLAGTLGNLGCFSMKDGKILWSGEGGFIVTDDATLAATCRAYRSHWTTPPTGQQPLSQVGNNYRLAEPLAAIARANLAQLDKLASLRREQCAALYLGVGDAPGLEAVPAGEGEDWNGFSPLWRIHLPDPRGFCRRLAERGVPNSVGTFRLVASDQRPMFARYTTTVCANAAKLIDTTLAVAITEHDDNARIDALAHTIIEEAHQWISDPG
jgi:perosamine synthetase